MIALDFCRPLLDQAKARGVKQTVEGDALNLPFPDQTMDAATLAFGLRNFAHRPKGLTEIARVLRPGGNLALLEFSPPPYPWRLFWDFYLFYFMPAVAQCLARQGRAFRYLAHSIAGFPPPAALDLELIAANLLPITTHSLSLGLVRLTFCRKNS